VTNRSHPRRVPLLRRLATANGPFLASLASLLVLWEVVGRTANILILPPFSDVLVGLWGFIADGTLAERLGGTLLALGAGMAISIVAGVLIGALMGRFRTVEYALDIYVNAAMGAPMVAFIPVFVLLFGVGYESRIASVVVFAIFPIIVNTATGIKNVNTSLVAMARSFGASEPQMLRWVRLPDAFPMIRSGLRLGASRGVKGVINGEVIIAVVGMGALVKQYGTAFSMDRLYAIVLVLIALAMVTVWIVDRVTGRLIRQGN
jgi:NitT/TauT family transport system permease protein